MISSAMFSGGILIVWDCICQGQKERVAVDIWWDFRQALYLWRQDRKAVS